MFEVDKFSSFFTKLSKNNMGASWGVSDAPNTPMMGGIMMGHLLPPMLFFSKNKNYLSNQMHSYFPRTKITWGGHHVPPMMGGIRHYPPFVHHPQHPSPAHHTHHHPHHPHPPTEKKWGLNA